MDQLWTKYDLEKKMLEVGISQDTIDNFKNLPPPEIKKAIEDIFQLAENGQVDSLPSRKASLERTIFEASYKDICTIAYRDLEERISSVIDTPSFRKVIGQSPSLLEMFNVDHIKKRRYNDLVDLCMAKTGKKLDHVDDYVPTVHEYESLQHSLYHPENEMAEDAYTEYNK